MKSQVSNIQLHSRLQRGSQHCHQSQHCGGGREGTVGNFGSLVCCLSCGLGNLRSPSKALSLPTLTHPTTQMCFSSDAVAYNARRILGLWVFSSPEQLRDEALTLS